jgi:hypothetical protein
VTGDRQVCGLGGDAVVTVNESLLALLGAGAHIASCPDCNRFFGPLVAQQFARLQDNHEAQAKQHWDPCPAVLPPVLAFSGMEGEKAILILQAPAHLCSTLQIGGSAVCTQLQPYISRSYSYSSQQ